MIVGLSGYAKSGKDTVAEMIQELTTVNGTTPWVIKKYSGKLKEVASILTGIPVDNFEMQSTKEMELGEEWDGWGYRGRNDGTPVMPHFTGDPYRKRMTVRELLQRLGTDAIRNNLHDNAWVNALMSEYRPPKLSEYYPSKWIITDVRFQNEAHAIKERGGFIVRVHRPGVGPVNNHPSETSLDEWPFDYILTNDTDLAGLKESVKQLIDARL